MQKEFTYQEAMAILKISRANFYVRLDKSKTFLEGHILTKDGKKYVTAEGIEILKNSNIIIEKQTNESAYSKEVERLENQIKMMAEQLAFHQEQIREKDAQIKVLTTLHQNEQLLLRQAQEQYKLLTEPVEEKEKKGLLSFLRFKK